MKLGNINAYTTCFATANGKNFSFKGTPYELVKSALENGAELGDIISANYGTGKGVQQFELVYSPKDDRFDGIWIKDI